MHYLALENVDIIYKNYNLYMMEIPRSKFFATSLRAKYRDILLAIF